MGGRRPWRTDRQCNYIVSPSSMEAQAMKTRIVRIGNSQGVRIPKPLLAAAGLEEEVEMTVEDGRIIIERSAGVRVGWTEAAERLAARGAEAPLLKGAPPTEFDDAEWAWPDEFGTDEGS